MNHIYPQVPERAMTAECECEHIDHFEGEGDPNAHRYGHECDLETMTQVQTEFGTFTVCVDCARTHLREEAR